MSRDYKGLTYWPLRVEKSSPKKYYTDVSKRVFTAAKPAV